MGRGRKPPVDIEKVDIETEFTPDLADLPPMKTFIESTFRHKSGDGTKLKQIDRFFLRQPTDQEKTETIALKERGKDEKFIVDVLNINLFDDKMIRKHKPLTDSVSELGFDSAVAENIARIFISKLDNGKIKAPRLQNYQISILAFLMFIKKDFLENKKERVLDFTLIDLTKEHFEQFKASLNMSSRSTLNGTQAFSNIRLLLLDYVDSTFKHWLKGISAGQSKAKKPSAEHTSPFFKDEDLYSDAVLYQMLGHFLSQFESICERFDYCNALTVDDMPEDWWDPRINCRQREISGGASIPHEYEKWQYLEKLLKEKRYEDILKHELIFYKLGYTANQNKAFIHLQIIEKNKINDYETRLSKYYDFLKSTHYIDPTIHNSYLSGFDRSIKNTFHQLMGWCLANVLMIFTGLNKEVARSIPSLSDSGVSVLENPDIIFLRKEQNSEIQLYGWKERTGSNTRTKMIEAPIQKDGSLHKYLKRYEKHKTTSEGPFFEVKSKGWNDASFAAKGSKTFLHLFPIFDDKGAQLRSIDTRKFRKIYANAGLLELIDGAESPQELADKIPSILQHKGLDTFINHYLFNTNRGAVAIDTAIVGITNSKLDESVIFKGKIEIPGEEKDKKKEDNRIKVFLCDCENPFNPSHNEVIHKRCKHYDLCLGCERSMVCLEHLPYICARIIQYEEFRERNSRLWSEFYEDKYMIANDALDKYAKLSGVDCVESAWAEARSGKIKLPPLLKGFL